MFLFFHTHTEIPQGGFAYPEVAGREFHHRILQERQMPDDTVIAADGDRGDERFRKAHQNASEIVGCGESGSEFRIGQDDVIARCDIVARVSKGKPHIAAAAKNVYGLSGIAQGVEIPQRVGKNNPIEVRLLHNCLSFAAKITGSHEK